MSDIWENIGFRPADILLPHDCDLTKWSVVACDQYTSQPDYWDRVAEFVGDAPSTLKLTLPEVKLEKPGTAGLIQDIHQNMSSYLSDKLFDEYRDSLIYVERLLSDGSTRRGIIGAIDLEEYNYEGDVKGMTRPTEEVVLSRIPPRVSVRSGAKLELPHILMLIDDPDKTVVEPLAEKKNQMIKLYDFDLMENGGHITGYLLTPELMTNIAIALTRLADPERFNHRFETSDEPVLLYCVGDGNHSLASAKAIYEKSKGTPNEKITRYSLVELGNLFDDSLVFEPIHRVVFGVDPNELMEDIMKTFPGSHYGMGEGQDFAYCYGSEEGHITITNASHDMPLATLQEFLDEYIENHGGSIDYVHGEGAVRTLAAKPGNIGFLLKPMKKTDLMRSVIFDGKLPRKAFSMGHANDKRYYLEARRITVD